MVVVRLEHSKLMHSVFAGDVESITDEQVEQLFREVNKFALAAHFYWGFWALVQACHSDIDYDYLGFAIKRFTEYFRRKEEFLGL
jgi:ethanolamine kinase